IDYSATIAWGDGSSSVGSFTRDTATGAFTVRGSHTYTAAGTFPIIVTINHGGTPAATADTMAVAAGALDPGFGTAGEVVTGFGYYSNYAQAVVVQPDGKVLAAGVAGTQPDGRF